MALDGGVGEAGLGFGSSCLVVSVSSWGAFRFSRRLEVMATDLVNVFGREKGVCWLVSGS